jgi:hypothetical protein
MTLREFLDTGYALLVEGLVGIGVPLPKALDDLGNMAAQRIRDDAPPQREAALARQNEQALAQLQKGMAGIR